jgi:hypothetical protein
LNSKLLGFRLKFISEFAKLTNILKQRVGLTTEGQLSFRQGLGEDPLRLIRNTSARATKVLRQLIDPEELLSKVAAHLRQVGNLFYGFDQ